MQQHGLMGAEPTHIIIPPFLKTLSRDQPRVEEALLPERLQLTVSSYGSSAGMFCYWAAIPAQSRLDGASCRVAGENDGIAGLAAEAITEKYPSKGAHIGNSKRPKRHRTSFFVEFGVQNRKEEMKVTGCRTNNTLEGEERARAREGPVGSWMLWRRAWIKKCGAGRCG